MISSHDGELELLVYWTGTVSVVSHTDSKRLRETLKYSLNYSKLFILFLQISLVHKLFLSMNVILTL